jgi:hypothetical protein
MLIDRPLRALKGGEQILQTVVTDAGAVRHARGQHIA